MEEDKKMVIETTFEAIFKSTYGQIPLIGSVLAHLSFEYSSMLKQKRLNNFFEKLQHYMEGVSESEINLGNILTEDFHDIFEAILKSVSRTKSEEKLERFKNILIKQLRKLEDYKDIEPFIEITDKLSETHIAILNFYNKNYLSQKNFEETINKERKKLKKLQQNHEVIDITKFNQVKLRMLKQESLKKIEDCEKNIERLEEDYIDDFHSIDFENKELLTSSKNLYLINELKNMFLIENTSDKRVKKDLHSFMITSFGIEYINYVKTY